MRIVHVCLACFYVEGWGYQENILPKHHVRMGHDVMVLTSDYAFNSQSEKTAKQERDYVNVHGVHVKVLDRSSRYGGYSRFGDYEKVYEELEIFRPDVVFVHGGQFVALKDIFSYCRRHRNVKLYIDQHADFYNSPVKTIKQKVAAKVIYGHWIRKCAKLAQKLWGVTPWRCQYLHEVYGVPKEKIDLLVMGGDDDLIPFARADELQTQIKKSLGIPEDAFVVCSGGKIDSTKNIHLLMQAVCELEQRNVHAIIFGQPTQDMKEKIQQLAQEQRCHYIGWIDSARVYDYFLASDLVVFPGTHSVLWEQACACGTPVVVKSWEGMHHVCVNGNGKFLYDDSVEEIKEIITGLLDEPRVYAEMKMAAEQCKNVFFYSKIAERAIGLRESG